MILMIHLTFHHMLRENRVKFIKRLTFSALRFFERECCVNTFITNVYRSRLSVIVWESVPGAKNCGQPIWLKLGTEVGCNEIFQKPIWLTSLTFSFGVPGGVSFFALWAPKIQPSRGHFESPIKELSFHTCNFSLKVLDKEEPGARVW